MSDAFFSKLLIHSVTIKRRTAGTVGNFNIPTETFTTISSGTSCRIEQISEAVEIANHGKKFLIKTLGFFEIDVNIEEDDIVEFNSKSYAVISIGDAGGEGHHIEVYLQALEN